MGGGDLNLKKSWHPATLKNQERVWKEERKHDEEQRKIDQMKKELMEERQLQELQRLQEESGQKKRSDRLDWMYAAPNQNSGSKNAEEMEEYLLGKKNVDQFIRDRNSKETVATSAAERFAISNSNANNERDLQSKIREDPLLMIRKREQQSLRAIMDNPLRLKELRKEKKDKKKKKKSKKEEGSRHGEENDKKRRRRQSSEDSMDNDDDRTKKSRHSHSHHRHLREDHRFRDESRDRKYDDRSRGRSSSTRDRYDRGNDDRRDGDGDRDSRHYHRT